MTDFSLKYMKYFPRKYMKSFPCKYMKTDFPHFPFMCQLLDTASALSISFPLPSSVRHMGHHYFGKTMKIKANDSFFFTQVMLQRQ